MGSTLIFMDLPFQVTILMSFSSDNTDVMDLTATGIGRMGPDWVFSSRTRSQNGVNTVVLFYGSPLCFLVKVH